MRAKLAFFMLWGLIILNFSCMNVFADEVRSIKIDGKKVKEIETFIDINTNEVFMNNRNLEYKGKPLIIQNNEVYFPMRDMCNILRFYNGPGIVWDDQTNTCSIRLYSEFPYMLSIPMNSNIYYEWGQAAYTEKKACLINGSAYIPLSLLQTIFHIPDESIKLDIPNKTLEITRSFSFETDKISILEHERDMNTRTSYMKKIDITDQKLIKKITDGLYEGFHKSSHTYGSINVIWLDFNNGTFIGLNPEYHEKYTLDYCSLSVGVDELPSNAFELSDNARETLAKIFKECDITG